MVQSGSIAAVINTLGQDAVESVLLMLQELGYQGDDIIRITTPTETFMAKSIKEFENKRISSSIAVGNRVSNCFPSELELYALKKDCSFAFEGHLFPPLRTSEVISVASNIESDTKTTAENIIRKFDGAYIFAAILSDRIIAGRDMLGVSPLYIGEGKAIYALASERKALWKLGIAQIKSFPPGYLATITRNGFLFEMIETLRQPTQKRMGIERAARRLQDLLQESIIERISGTNELAVAFSGGLDSSIISVLAKNCAKKVNLVTVGLEGQPELRHAEMAAKALALPLIVKKYTISDVENAIKKVLWLIEDPNPIKVGVAIPLFWTAQVASQTGCRVLLSGQGADEILGGYTKYLDQYSVGGEEAVQKAMFNDLVFSHETNIQRDTAVCHFHEVQLRLPFIDRQVVKFVLSLALDLKIKSPEDKIRKHVLRRVAQNIGLPLFVCEKTKKAMQYATGVSKTLKRLAQRKGLTQKDYLAQLFDEIYQTNLKGIEK